MNHKLKTTVFKVLDKLPNRLGYFVYHKLQNISSKLTIEDKIKSTESSYNLIKSILQEKEIQLENKTVVEIGSGWMPVLPYLLIYDAGVKKVLTYDINKHYQPKRISQLNKIFEEKYNRNNAANDTLLQTKLNSKVVYFPYTNVADGELEEADIIISRFVLEHISPMDIESMHQSFADKLKKGACILHLISPGDHRAYTDKSISLYDFLKYSQQEWDAIQTKFDYHNRLRLPQYLEILQQNFEVIYVEYSSCVHGSTEHQKLDRINIHEDFKSFSFEELTAGSINVLLKKVSI